MEIKSCETFPFKLTTARTLFLLAVDSSFWQVVTISSLHFREKDLMRRRRADVSLRHSPVNVGLLGENDASFHCGCFFINASVGHKMKLRWVLAGRVLALCLQCSVVV